MEGRVDKRKIKRFFGKYNNEYIYKRNYVRFNMELVYIVKWNISMLKY